MDNRKCFLMVTGITGSLTAIGAIIILVVGLGLVASNSTSMQLESFKNSTCFLTAITITELSADMFCYTDRFVTVYRNFDGYSAIDNPYAAFAVSSNTFSSDRSSRPIEINYRLNTNISCFCDSSYNSSFYLYPNVKSFLGCNTDTQCFLNVKVIQEIKDKIVNYNYALLLLQIGFLILSGVVVLSFIVTVIILCCIKDRKQQYQNLN